MKYDRIISLVPSLTELVLDLGLKDRVVGRTRFCVHPNELVKDIPIIGGTKTLNIEKILALKPDYVIANHEENRKEDIEFLQKKVKVNVTLINTIQDAINVINELGRDFDTSLKAKKLVKNIHDLLSDTPKLNPLKTAYFIWKDPWMVASSETYIDSILSHYKLDNVFSDKKRYPQVSIDELAEKSPDLILLSSEPYPFKEKHITEIKNACPDAKIQLINGEWFSWYGSGMINAFRELNKWRIESSSF